MTTAEKVPPDHGHTWRYCGRSGYPAPDGISATLHLTGGGTSVSKVSGRHFFVFSEGYFSVHDPANGGYAVDVTERGMIRRVEISAL